MIKKYLPSWTNVLHIIALLFLIAVQYTDDGKWRFLFFIIGWGIVLIHGIVVFTFDKKKRRHG